MTEFFLYVFAGTVAIGLLLRIVVSLGVDVWYIYSRKEV